MSLLTQAEVDKLPDDTKILVIWSGGNGPHEYTTWRYNDTTYAKRERFVVGPLLLVGKEEYHDRVVVVTPTSESAK